MEPDAHPVLRVVSGSPTPSELAAVATVLAALESEAAGDALVPSAEPAGPSPWERSRRGLRTPLTRGPGAWQRFGA